MSQPEAAHEEVVAVRLHIEIHVDDHLGREQEAKACGGRRRMKAHGSAMGQRRALARH
jgi:uncharacterized protein Veg